MGIMRKQQVKVGSHAIMVRLFKRCLSGSFRWIGAFVKGAAYLELD